MQKIIYGGVAIFLALSLAGCDSMTKQDVGTLAGAAVGGVVGSRFGKGQGQIVGAVGGAVLGGFVGSQIGKSMDKTDRLEMQQALEQNRAGQTSTWRNPDTNATYHVKPTKTYKKDNQYCREYVTTATIAGKQQQMYGTACRQPDGTWKMVSSHNG